MSKNQKHCLLCQAHTIILHHLLEQELLHALHVLWGAGTGGAGVPVHCGGSKGVRERALDEHNV